MTYEYYLSPHQIKEEDYHYSLVKYIRSGQHDERQFILTNIDITRQKILDLKKITLATLIRDLKKEQPYERYKETTKLKDYNKGIKWRAEARNEDNKKAINRLEYNIEFYNIKLNRLPKLAKKEAVNLINGKQLNLSERFTIAKKVLNIESILRTLDIPDLQKYELLAIILGCNKDNARDLMNGKYNSKERDLSDYILSLNLKQ